MKDVIYKNRYDVTLLINGLPLVQVELKRPGVEINEAINQINRYRRFSFKGLFRYIQIFVQPLSSVSLTNIVGVLRGGGDVRYAMLCDVGPLYAVCLPLAALTALVWKLDIRYVYPFMSIDMFVQLFLVIPRLRSGKWIHDVTRTAGELEA